MNEAIIYVNVTAPNGELLGRFPVYRDELSHPEWLGGQILNQLPLPGTDAWRAILEGDWEES